MEFSNDEKIFFEIEKNIYNLYVKFKPKINKKLLDDLYFLLEEENIILEKVLLSHSNIISLASYCEDELSIKFKKYFHDTNIRENMTQRIVNYLFNRLSLNPFPNKIDSFYYSYVTPVEKRELEEECADINSLIIISYCNLCLVYRYYYLLQEKISNASKKTKTILTFRRYAYIYENKILEKYLVQEMKESELPNLSRLEDFYHDYEEIEKESMDFFEDIIITTIENFFDNPDDKFSDAWSYVNYLNYELNIQASLRILSDKSFFSIFSKIKELNKNICDEEQLKKFHEIYPLFLIEKEKRKQKVKVKTTV